MTEQKKLPSIETLEQIDLPTFDPTPFIGKKAMIDEIELKHKVQPDGKDSYYIQFKALVDPKGFNNEPLYASRNVGVQVDENNKMGWGEKTKMAEFLTHHKVTHPKDMKGKTIIVQTQKDSTYLTF